MGYANLIVFLTHRCVGGCATCNVKAAPDSSGFLGKEDLNHLFEHSAVSGIRHVIWTGGEPFENFDALNWGILRAEEMGLRSEILTSGYWFRSSPQRLKNLAGAGRFSLRVSIDREHLKTMGVESILALAGKCIALDIPMNFTVRNIPGDSTWKQLLKRLDRGFPEYTRERRKDPRWVHKIPHIPVEGDDPYLRDGGSPSPLSGCAMAFRDLVTGWDGNFYPCCGLFSLSGFEKYALGGIAEPESADGRAEALFKRIRLRGPEVIRELAGGPQGEKADYLNNCHACISLLRRYENSVGRYLAGETLR